MAKQNKSYQLDFHVDIVFCIDATGSMHHILDTVKSNALNLYDDIIREMKKKRKTVTQVRVRVVAFRDFHYDRDDAVFLSDFFRLPEQADAFRSYVEGIRADGGGDDPEDGLEALAFAMKSDWSNSAKRQRHIIVVWSDDGTHELGYGRQAENYPRGMARSFDELTQWWGWGNENAPGLMNEEAKRLLLFTPDKPFWSTIRETWNKVVHYRTTSGSGLRDVSYVQILSAITRTI